MLVSVLPALKLLANSQNLMIMSKVDYIRIVSCAGCHEPRKEKFLTSVCLFLSKALRFPSER